jgi:periplasmic protein CpxP/Spy
MKTPNRLTILCGVAMASMACNLVAQTNPPAAPSGNTAECPKGKHQGGKLAQALGLSDEQKAKVAPILEKAKSDTKAIKADESLTKKQKHEQIEAIRQATQQQLQAVLTPEQFQKFQEIRAEHKGQRGQGGKVPAPAA